MGKVVAFPSTLERSHRTKGGVYTYWTYKTHKIERADRTDSPGLVDAGLSFSVWRQAFFSANFEEFLPSSDSKPEGCWVSGSSEGAWLRKDRSPLISETVHEAVSLLRHSKSRADRLMAEAILQDFNQAEASLGGGCSDQNNLAAVFRIESIKAL